MYLLARWVQVMKYRQSDIVPSWLWQVKELIADIVETAARLRAKLKLKLPDVI